MDLLDQHGKSLGGENSFCLTYLPITQSEIWVLCPHILTTEPGYTLTRITTKLPWAVMHCWKGGKEILYGRWQCRLKNTWSRWVWFPSWTYTTQSCTWGCSCGSPKTLSTSGYHGPICLAGYKQQVGTWTWVGFPFWVEYNQAWRLTSWVCWTVNKGVLIRIVLTWLEGAMKVCKLTMTLTEMKAGNRGGMAMSYYFICTIGIQKRGASYDKQ